VLTGSRASETADNTEESVGFGSTASAPPGDRSSGHGSAGRSGGQESLSRADLVDRHVGIRIRERRLMLGLSQQQLANLIGVTYQQAHKYERGLNRISAGRLFEIAQVLSIGVGWFFEGIDGAAEPVELTARQRMGLELARNFAAIGNEKHQQALSHLARALVPDI
jgi:transcriptional regulator with XRE-family HTH domain